ncbi:MAG: glycosyltransferase family 1 protein [Verrucomicrobiae bacterium]
MRIVVTGLIGQYAFGGVTWDYIQYLLGFRALGHDVWYLEDTSAWAYDPVKQEPSADCSHNTGYLGRVMREFDMGDRWIYRNGADGTYHGVADAGGAEKILASADVLANVSGACWLREPTAAIPLKLFLDGDPMFTQISLAADPASEFSSRVTSHDRHFSFGLNIGREGCRVPECGLDWRPTVQPVALDWWSNPLMPAGAGHIASDAWTTVMNWASYAPKEFGGLTYGQKDLEFSRFLDLPALTPEKFVLAMGQGVGQNRPTETLAQKGWTIIEPDVHIPDYASYHDFLTNSKGEWSIAKNGYVRSRSGWFSCRSACYLAAGKPVVVQDTGWTDHLPSGEGVLAFSSPEEAAAGIAEVSSDYPRHCRAARAFAEKHFGAEKVCAELLG